jgi:hypothetical protein
MYDTSNILHLYCIFTVYLTFLRLSCMSLWQFQLYSSVFVNTSKVSHRFSLRLVYVLEPVHSVPVGSVQASPLDMVASKCFSTSFLSSLQASACSSVRIVWPSLVINLYTLVQWLNNSRYHVRLFRRFGKRKCLDMKI